MDVYYKFLFYHPYWTYSSNQKTGCFITPDGKEQKYLVDCDLSSLWFLGKEAYFYTGTESKESFDENLKNYFDLLGNFRNVIKKRNDIIFVSAETGEEIKPDIDNISEYDVLHSIKDLFLEQINTEWKEKEALSTSLMGGFLVCCLRCIDDALVVGMNNRLEAIPYITEATKAFYDFKSLESAKNTGKNERTKLAIKAANARHSENRAMKKMVFEWYGKNKDTFPSKDKAAEKATKLVPVGFRTARKWIDEYGKNTPSASRV